jgi:hypothetical protein
MCGKLGYCHQLGVGIHQGHADSLSLYEEDKYGLRAILHAETLGATYLSIIWIDGGLPPVLRSGPSLAVIRQRGRGQRGDTKTRKDSSLRAGD